MSDMAGMQKVAKHYPATIAYIALMVTIIVALHIYDLLEG